MPFLGWRRFSWVRGENDTPAWRGMHGGVWYGNWFTDMLEGRRQIRATEQGLAENTPVPAFTTGTHATIAWRISESDRLWTLPARPDVGDVIPDEIVPATARIRAGVPAWLSRTGLYAYDPQRKPARRRMSRSLNMIVDAVLQRLAWELQPLDRNTMRIEWSAMFAGKLITDSWYVGKTWEPERIAGELITAQEAAEQTVRRRIREYFAPKKRRNEEDD